MNLQRQNNGSKRQKRACHPSCSERLYGVQKQSNLGESHNQRLQGQMQIYGP